MDKKTEEIKKKHGKLKLNLGCGRDIREGYLNIDRVDLKGVDLVYNLDDYPYPFKNDSVEEIQAISMIEHITDLVKFMEELYRICKNNATVVITAPHYRSVTAYADPTHKHFFTPDSFDYFTGNHVYNFYTNARFKIIKKEMVPTKIGKFLSRKLLRVFGFFLGGFIQSMYFEMKVSKNRPK